MGQFERRAFAPQSRSQRPEKSLSGPVAPAAAATSEVEEQRERGWGPASTKRLTARSAGGNAAPPARFVFAQRPRSAARQNAAPAYRPLCWRWVPQPNAKVVGLRSVLSSVACAGSLERPPSRNLSTLVRWQGARSAAAPWPLRAIFPRPRRAARDEGAPQASRLAGCRGPRHSNIDGRSTGLALRMPSTQTDPLPALVLYVP